MKQPLALICLVALGLLIVGAIYLVSPLSRRTRPLRVLVTNDHGGYRAILVNRGLLPVVVGRCETISDALEKDTRVGDVVQRSQSGSSSWENILKRNECRVVPVGIVKATSKRTLLWPGQQLHSAWFFPNVGVARSPFQHGDKVRLLIFTHTPKEDTEGIPSPQFMIQ